MTRLIALMVSSLLFSTTAIAAKGGSSRAEGSPSTESLKYRYEMNVDLQAVYTRNTRPVGGSDTAARLNLGGMFSNWIGAEATGMFQTKSKSFLVGGTMKIVPIDWFFVKGGYGAYADRKSGELKGTPLVGTGVVGRFTEYYYMIAEGSYFQTPDQARNIGIGIGFGTIF